MGFSDAGLLTLLSGGPGYSARMYGRIITMQGLRIPQQVITGKRLYTNMLIQSVGTETSEGTEYSAIVVVRLRQIIIVQTQTTTVPPKANQAAPQTSAATENTGTKQPATPAAPTSVLASIFGGNTPSPAAVYGPPTLAQAQAAASSSAAQAVSAVPTVAPPALPSALRGF